VKIPAVILAAGSSRRLGRPKQTVVLNGETLLERAVRTAQEARLSPIVAVVPDAEWTDSLHPSGATVLLNHEAAEGIAASIRLGVSWARNVGASGVVLMTCDQVAVTAAHLRALCDVRAEPTGSGYAGKVGIPAYFPEASFAALLRLTGDTGARDLLRHARSVPTEALAFDIDTEQDVALAQALLE